MKWPFNSVYEGAILTRDPVLKLETEQVFVPHRNGFCAESDARQSMLCRELVHDFDIRLDQVVYVVSRESSLISNRSQLVAEKLFAPSDEPTLQRLGLE